MSYKKAKPRKENLKINVKAKKALGQCFLSDENIARKIVELSKPSKDNVVVEVGPGLGAITKYLVNSYKRVIAYEIDEDVVEPLHKNTNNAQNLDLIMEDILKANLDYLDKIEEEIVSVSNLPYYITSPIIAKFIDGAKSIKRMYFMVQKEMADRLSAPVSTKDYNAFSIYVQYKANVKTVLNVKRTCFTPSPNVDSAVIEISRIDREFKPNNEEKFRKIVETSFKERRKTLVNNLSNLYTKEKILNVLNKLELNPSIRAENLSIDEFIELSNELEVSGNE
ncbi:MAG: 16S rRNA (adenine(1518)-N(6)/adenine(1519)-N(6))-dimethyltransferase RsmA [Gammaproteobacteria bacterium]|nr:16S rRNA (adenine(1518)-N(6)/adenine(1519)-N(6))-dimethyltransferase RsmA [Gammaproteobacteria bacterium]